MLFWPVALFAATLPFTSRLPLFSLGAVAVDLPLLAACLAVLAGLARAFLHNPRFDALDWSAVALAGTWLLSALATPVGSPTALVTAWKWSLGPALFVLIRGALEPEERRLVAGLAFAGAIVALLVAAFSPGHPTDLTLWFAVAASAFLPLARKRRGLAITTALVLAIWSLALVVLNRPPVSLAIPMGRPLLGWGAGSQPGLPLFPGLLAGGGLVGALAVAAVAWFGLRSFRAMLRKRPRPPEASAVALAAAAFLLAGIVINPLRSLPGALGIWLALGILLPPARHQQSAFSSQQSARKR